MSGERIFLQRKGLIISEIQAHFPGGVFPLVQIEESWVETRRPGFQGGVVAVLLGAVWLFKTPGILRILGLISVIYGLIRARDEEYLLVLRIQGIERPQEVLRTREKSFIFEVLSVLTNALKRAI